MLQGANRQALWHQAVARTKIHPKDLPQYHQGLWPPRLRSQEAQQLSSDGCKPGLYQDCGKWATTLLYEGEGCLLEAVQATQPAIFCMQVKLN